MENLPTLIAPVFMLITALTAFLFYKAANGSRTVLLIIFTLLIAQGITGLTGFYTNTVAIPPRLIFLVGPSLVLIILLFATQGGRMFLTSLNPKFLTYLHVVRLPVEIVLLYLFLYGQVPQLMTFEGRNFDIMAGITAAFVAYFGYSRSKLTRTFLVFWNVVCLLLLLNIVVHGILSAPTPFQQFAFEQPNRALAYFPFVWLPAFIVPVVLLSHLVCIIRLLEKRKAVIIKATLINA